jgi:hypothetical protein
LLFGRSPVLLGLPECTTSSVVVDRDHVIAIVA